MNTAMLAQTARALVADNKGILAADESTGSITKHFEEIGVPSTADTRRAYRDMLFTTPGMEAYISGVIMFDETIRERTSGGVPFATYLNGRGILPGIKVDTGVVPLRGESDEVVTEGLQGLRERLAEYAMLGARFAKWRAVIKIAVTSDGSMVIPTEECLRANAERLASYARQCQEQGLVPIVEPEVLMNGAHSLEHCADVTLRTHQAVFAALGEHDVYLPGMLLKSNMVVPGEDAGVRAAADIVARSTVELLKKTVPADVPGVVFLSGGQSEADATLHLHTMNARYADLPWTLSFSYGRALQHTAMHTWAGKSDRVESAQQEFLRRARLNSLACAGKYAGEE